MRDNAWVRVIWVLFVAGVVGAQVALNWQLNKIVAWLPASVLGVVLTCVVAVGSIVVGGTFLVWAENDFKQFDAFAVLRRDNWRLRATSRKRR